MQAFRKSIKKKKNEDSNNLEKELQSLISKNASACAAKKSEPQLDSCEDDSSRRNCKQIDDDIEDVNECKVFKKKKYSPMKVEEKSKTETDDGSKVAVAFQNSFGKLRRPNRTSNSSNKF